jgi:chemotaxis protein methyltransferase WspC
MSLRQLLKESTGLELSGADVERAVRERMQLGGIARPEDYAAVPGSAEFEALVDLVVVPESWMWREPAMFTEALRFVQQRLAVRGARPVRILSLPCAGGEEAYSMAMALHGAGIAPARCRIDAFDLSQAAIARARAGRYTRNAFRGGDLAFRERWFSRSGDDYLVADALREYVHFGQGNLFALDALASGQHYDLVFCRNLLIYFDQATRARAAGVLQALLADDGVLLSGHAEAPAFCRHGFAPTSLRTAFALHKAVPRAAPAVRRAAGGAAQRPRPHVPPTAAPALQQSAPPPQARPSPDVLLADAQRHADAGRLAQAEAACREALAIRPDSADAWFLLGMVSECGGQPRAADRCWRRCVYLDPGHYEALCSLALLHERLGDNGTGAAFRQRAARIFGRRADMHPGAAT